MSTVSTATLNSWDPDFYVDNDLVSIEPGESLVLTGKLYIDQKALDNTENKLFQFSITPMFGQTR